jgi:uncharacterized protein YjbI with pentapeptide repeats
MDTTTIPAQTAAAEFVCDCEANMRAACAIAGYYKEREGKRYCVLHYPGDEKAPEFKIALNNKLSAKDYNFNGVWFPKGVRLKELCWSGNVDFSHTIFNENIDFSGVDFQVKALFNNARFSAGVDFSSGAFRAGADFSGTRFDEAAHFNSAVFFRSAEFSYACFSSSSDFGRARFSEKADFSRARFDGKTDFSKVSFDGYADFSRADFNGYSHFGRASFKGYSNFGKAGFSREADFGRASFSSEADFRGIGFTGKVDFRGADFTGKADFRGANFGATADFSFTSYKDYVYFGGSPERRKPGKDSRLNLQFAQFEKPDRVSFHTLDLQPHWFVNVDPRKFEFTDVEFVYGLKDEMERLNEAGVSAPHRLLAIAYRQLAINAEENHRYLQASRLRYAAFESRRIERFRGFTPWRLDWWYWLVSGYGEKVLRAVAMLIALWAFFAVGYTVTGFERRMPQNTLQAPITADEVGEPLSFKRALTYSLGVMSLQKPKPDPATNTAKALVTVEAILGPLQVALLALAIRRRFMR